MTSPARTDRSFAEGKMLQMAISASRQLRIPSLWLPPLEQTGWRDYQCQQVAPSRCFFCDASVPFQYKRCDLSSRF